MTLEALRQQSQKELLALAVFHLQTLVELMAPPEQPAACEHPIEARTEMSAMGQAPWTRFYCSACREYVPKADR